MRKETRINCFGIKELALILFKMESKENCCLAGVFRPLGSFQPPHPPPFPNRNPLAFLSYVFLFSQGKRLSQAPFSAVQPFFFPLDSLSRNYGK